MYTEGVTAPWAGCGNPQSFLYSSSKANMSFHTACIYYMDINCISFGCLLLHLPSLFIFPVLCQPPSSARVGVMCRAALYSFLFEDLEAWWLPADRTRACTPAPWSQDRLSSCSRRRPVWPPRNNLQMHMPILIPESFIGMNGRDPTLPKHFSASVGWRWCTIMNQLDLMQESNWWLTQQHLPSSDDDADISDWWILYWLIICRAAICMNPHIQV